ncbi:hypothetical protein TYRP_019569 [Tyrophagus putrescentiae]|nr:hypothetical protein TYRP_019569 [Tyrophagus putrescentiae]
MATEKKPFSRLPKNVSPTLYDLTLKPDLKAFTFEGTEKISIKVNEATQTIVFNTNEIVIKKDSLVLSYGTDKSIDVEKIETSVENETTTLHFKETLVPGDALLSFTFTGKLCEILVSILNDKMKGFYRSKYHSTDGENKYAAVTQFEATDARRAFPCWDEPAIKASFDVTLVIPDDGKTIALSNMSVQSETVKENSKSVRFNRTPIMSTYLIAFIVGEYDFIETKSEDGVRVRVYAPFGKIEQCRFALEMSGKALDFYHKYFKIAYPLDKIDLIAISDFAAGAMENWGLVTYRETCLLVDPNNTSTARKQWLINGSTQFVSDTYLEALELDGLENSHPIEVPVGHPSEVDEIFDDISYNKGASVIRMLHKYLGDDTFREGMNHYLTKWSYKNTQTEDLWDALEEASKKPVRRVMSTWTQQKGYPVISVTGSSGAFVLEQEKFNLTGILSEEDKKSLWAVPLEWGANEWFKLNPGSVGVYRVKYTSEMLDKFVPAIVSQQIPPLDRLGLLSDLYALVIAGKQSTVDLLKFIAAFEKETDYTVWSALNMIIVNSLPALTSTRRYRVFCRHLLTNSAFPHVGWEPKPSEPHLDTLLRSLVINRLVTLEDEAVLAHCREMFKEQVEQKKAIIADLRVPVYRSVAHKSDDVSYETLMKLYRESDMQEEKNRLSTSLGHLKSLPMIEKVLKFSICEEVRSQDSVFVIGSIANNPLGRDLAWSFFKENRKLFIERYDAGSLICRLIKLVTEHFNTEERANEVETFFKENAFPGSERTVQQAVETIRLNAAVMKRDAAGVKAYLLSKPSA